MNQPEPLDLDAIEARANAATPGPWERYAEYGAQFYANTTGEYLRGIGDFSFGEGEQADADEAFVRHAREDIDTLLAEVRRFRAQQDVLASLAERWQQMADHGDAAIGHFDGPAAAILSAEVGERGRTYRKAADDVREVLRTGRIPHDLMTDAELAAAAVPAVPATTKDGAQ